MKYDELFFLNQLYWKPKIETDGIFRRMVRKRVARDLSIKLNQLELVFAVWMVKRKKSIKFLKIKLKAAIDLIKNREVINESTTRSWWLTTKPATRNEYGLSWLSCRNHRLWPPARESHVWEALWCVRSTTTANTTKPPTEGRWGWWWFGIWRTDPTTPPHPLILDLNLTREDQDLWSPVVPNIVRGKVIFSKTLNPLCLSVFLRVGLCFVFCLLWFMRFGHNFLIDSQIFLFFHLCLRGFDFLMEFYQWE